MHWCATVELPTASRNISVVPVIDKAEKIRLRMPSPTNAVEKSWGEMREAVIRCKVASENIFSIIVMVALHPSSPSP